MRSTIQHPNICARNGCSNKGIHLLSVLYINREGWFCEGCKQELEDAGLVFEDKQKGWNDFHTNPTSTTLTGSSAAIITTKTKHSDLGDGLS